MPERSLHTECSDTLPGIKGLREDSRKHGVQNPDNLPFMLWPQGATKAALLIHGFTATPWEMRLLAEHLASAKIASLAVRLPGHGTTPEDLVKRNWKEWYHSALTGFEILTQEFSSLHIAGMSTGCLLALALAAQKPVSGLVLFSPYLKVLHWLAPYAGWLRWIRPYHVIPNAEPDPHYYNRRPVAGVHQINQLVNHVRGQLPNIHCPTLAFNAEGDQTVDIDSGRELVNLLGSTTKRYERYGPEVPHVLTREENPFREEMFSLASQFILGEEKSRVEASVK